MAVCFSEAMLAMQAQSALGASFYNSLCNEADGAIWALENTAFSLLEVGGGVLAVIVGAVVVKRVHQALLSG